MFSEEIKEGYVKSLMINTHNHIFKAHRRLILMVQSIFLWMVFFCLGTGMSHAAPTPIMSELFPDNNIASRGWTDPWGNPFSMPTGVDSATGMNYLRVVYTGGTNTNPQGYYGAKFKTFNGAITPKEVTIRYFVRFKQWKWGQPNHFLGLYCHPFNWDQRNEVAFEPSDDGIPTAGWAMMLDSTNVARYKYNFNYNTGMTANTWYEIRVYAKANSANNVADGQYVMEQRKYGDTAWTRVITHSVKAWPYANGYNPQGFGRVGLRFYAHNGAPAGDEIQLAKYQVYLGNQLGVELDGATPAPAPASDLKAQ